MHFGHELSIRYVNLYNACAGPNIINSVVMQLSGDRKSNSAEEYLSSKSKMHDGYKFVTEYRQISRN